MVRTSLATERCADLGTLVSRLVAVGRAVARSLVAMPNWRPRLWPASSCHHLRAAPAYGALHSGRICRYAVRPTEMYPSAH